MSFKVVSLFSGGGGLDLGFRNSGFEIIWAIDNQPNAVETYKLNLGNHIVCGDINEININSIPAADVIIGGPPCQSFSLAGKRNTEDDRGKLVWRYIEIISAKKPKAFLFENVTGLLSSKTKSGEKIIDQLLLAFKEIGYIISWQVINAVDYGVPQKRKRVIVVGIKEDRKFDFPKPTHSSSGDLGQKHVTVAEALGDLPPAVDNSINVVYQGNPQNLFQKLMRSKNGFVTEHVIPTMSELDKYIISYVKPGGNYMDIPGDVKSKRIQRLQRDGGHTTCYGRMCPEEPSYTINTYFNRPNVGCNIHYKENRLITIREAMRLQSFPDDFELISNSKQGKHLIIGNAVPPLLGKVLADQLLLYL